MIIKTCPQCEKTFRARKQVTIFCCRSCSNAHSSSKRLFRPDPSIFGNGIGPEEAYAIGFILADGCICCKKGKMTERKYITICNNDKDIIDWLHIKMCPDKKITITKTNCYYISSNNIIDIDFLNSIGIKEAKSLIVKMPILETNLYPHFLRGVFDGDGCVFIDKQRRNGKNGIVEYVYKRVSFTTGSLVFANELLSLLKKFKIHCTLTKDCRKDTYYININKRKDVESFYNLIYTNATIKIQYKYDIFNNDIVQPI